MTPEPYPDDPCLTPPAICDPRVRFFHDDGILFVTAAPPLPGTSPPDSFVAVWRDHGDAKPYVFARRIYTHTDLGHALLRLETILGVNRAQFTSNSSLLADAVTLALAAPPDATDWPLATHGAIAVALDFDAADISDPTFLLADDDHGGDLDTEDECHNNSFTTGTDGDYEFTATDLLILDDLAIELTYGVDCCGTSDCCDNNGQCGQNEHCADGDCVPDECNGPEDCPEGSHCEGGECVDDACVLPTDCPPNMECIGGQCETPCNGNGDCPTGEECVGGVCENCPGVCCDNGDCEDGALCTIDQCRDGGCRHRYKNCTDGDKCTDDYCNPQTGQCEHVDNYDDDNPCTLDQCDPETGVATHTCLDECTACDEGFCVSCSCEEPGCSVQLDIEPQQVCSGGIVELTLTAECHPDCGDGALQFRTDPVDAGFTWMEPPPESIECDGQPHVIFLRARASCEERGFVWFIVELESPGNQNCTDDALTEVIQCPDVDMDSNRDGVVSDSDDDEEGEDAWQYGAGAKGAIVLVNCDADGGAPPVRDLDDSLVNSTQDVADLSELIIRPVPPAGLDGWKRRLRIPGNVALRVFPALIDQAQAILGPGQETYVIPDALDVELHYGVESVIHPGDRGHASFDGLVLVYVELLDEQDIVICWDMLQLRVAPFIMLSNTAPPHRALVSTGTNPPGLLGPFVEGQVGGGSMISIPYAACPDRWPQDAWEFGLSSRPLGSGSTWNLWSGFETLRHGRPLQPWGRTNLLGAVNGPPVDRVGLAFRLQDTDDDLAYGGNLELIPPYTDHPLGRIVVGSMPSVQVDFLNRQQVQGQVVQLDTSWLAVGHIDEYMSFVPDPSGFGVAFASPDYAKTILDGAADHEPLFYNNSSDAVYRGQPDEVFSNGFRDANPDPPVDFSTLIGGYVRIYAGKGAHQIARIAPGTTVDRIVLGELWWLRDARAVYISAVGPSSEWFLYRSGGAWHPDLDAGPPTTDSWYIVVPASKTWPRFRAGTLTAYNIPALVTASETRSDPRLWADVNTPIQPLLDSAWQTVRGAIGSSPAPDFLIPEMYLGELPQGSGAFTGNAFSYAPGSANMQVWDNQLWIAHPFGPRGDVSGQRRDLFAHEIETTLNSPGSRTVHWVDDWNTYHLGTGEVHCGTNVVRVAPDATYSRWWEVQP